MPFTKIESEKLSQAVVRQIEQLILRGILRPGDRLNEVALSKDLGVSRTPLREALNRLVAERLFAFRPGQGFFCRPLDAQSVFDLFELRQIIETAAARAACSKASDKDLQNLRGELYSTGIDITGFIVLSLPANGISGPNHDRMM